MQIPYLTYKPIVSVLNAYDVFLFDLWGVIIEGAHTYPNVVNTINHIIKHKKVFFVTNAPVHRKEMLSMMISWDIHVTESMVITSGDVATHMILDSEAIWGVKRPFIYHIEGDINYLISEELVTLTTNIHQADLLLLTLCCDASEDLNLDQWDDILKIAIQKKIPALCASPDIGISQKGIYRYCAGYFAEKIKQWGGEVIYAGKPYPAIYQTVLDQLPDIPKERILMIGDTFHTDILGANQVGIDAALVLTGNTTPFHSQYDKLEDKLMQLTLTAIQQKAIPNFVTQLG